ncbi:hypothetical protein [Luteolibacter marinus]|uniref:hypothetical protein n=1 Tax=Luteolibacter marinus TaxID=2776705 RepID=UPI0018696580|nr:hypothetical protein [Luteolibacter marinus]
MNMLQEAAHQERRANREATGPRKRDNFGKADCPLPFDIQPSTHGRLEELGPAALRAKLRNAEEQLTYWRGARFRAWTRQDKQAAGARVLLWEMELAAIKRRFTPTI